MDEEFDEPVDAATYYDENFRIVDKANAKYYEILKMQDDGSFVTQLFEIPIKLVEKPKE